MANEDEPIVNFNLSSKGKSLLRNEIVGKVEDVAGSYFVYKLVEKVMWIIVSGSSKKEARGYIHEYLGHKTDLFLTWLWNHVRFKIDHYAKPRKRSPRLSQVANFLTTSRDFKSIDVHRKRYAPEHEEGIAKKKTVFDRLGDASTSNSASAYGQPRHPAEDSYPQARFLHGNRFSLGQERKAKKTVFDRLGYASVCPPEDASISVFERLTFPAESASTSTLPVEHQCLNAYELVFLFAPSCQHSSGLRYFDNGVGPVLHGLWPCFFRQGWPGKEVIHYRFSQCCGLRHEYEKNGPPSVIREKMNKYWFSIFVNRENEDLWQHEWREHGQFNLFDSPNMYWVITLDAAQEFLEPGSGRNIMEILTAKLKLNPGGMYNCRKVVNDLRRELGLHIDVTFYEQDGVKYLHEFKVLYDEKMNYFVPQDGEWPTNNTYDKGSEFVFETMSCRRR